MLMLAHLLYIQDQVFAGNNTQQIASASEGPVSVSFQSPPTSSTFFYWLNATPYGSQIAAMLSVAAVSGFYVGGSPERAGFRKSWRRVLVASSVRVTRSGIEALKAKLAQAQKTQAASWLV